LSKGTDDLELLRPRTANGGFGAHVGGRRTQLPALDRQLDDAGANDRACSQRHTMGPGLNHVGRLARAPTGDRRLASSPQRDQIARVRSSGTPRSVRWPYQGLASGDLLRLRERLTTMRSIPAPIRAERTRTRISGLRAPPTIQSTLTLRRLTSANASPTAARMRPATKRARSR